MVKRFMKKKVDLNDRRAMVEFLSNHERYNTMNSWNRSTSYAHNIKIHKLGVEKEIEDALFELLDAQAPELEYELACLKRQFEEDTRHGDKGYSVFRNGRSDGYLVLYEVEYKNDGDPQKQRIQCVTMGRSIDMDEDFDDDDWDLTELRDRVELVQRFDEYVQDYIDTIIRFVTTHTCETHTVCVEQTVKVFI